MIENLQRSKIQDIADFMNMEDEDREKLVPLPEEKMADLAAICNRYPNLELVLNSHKIRAKKDEAFEI